MKKCIAALLAALLLCGCSSGKYWETVSDQIIEPEREPPRMIYLALPAGASSRAMSADNGDTVYFCDGYTITVVTRPAGDIDGTLRWLTGYSRDALTVVTAKEDACTRYYCAWTSAGEGGQQVGRAEVIDDGCYHYAVCVMSDGETTEDYTDAWEELFASMSLDAYSEATS